MNIMDSVSTTYSDFVQELTLFYLYKSINWSCFEFLVELDELRETQPEGWFRMHPELQQVKRLIEVSDTICNREFNNCADRLRNSIFDLLSKDSQTQADFLGFSFPCTAEEKVIKTEQLVNTFWAFEAATVENYLEKCFNHMYRLSKNFSSFV